MRAGTSPMNVLFVDQFGDLGGAQRSLLELMPAVLDNGWRAVVAAPEGELVERVAAAGAVVETIDPGSYASGRKSIRDAIRYATIMPVLGRKLAELVRRQRIDLLYINSPRPLSAAVMAGNVPMLFHAHSFLPPGVSRRIARAAVRSRHMRVIAVSGYVASYLTGAIPPARLTVIPNGVADAWRPRTASATPRIGIIGRIAPEKGQLDFVEAARLLPRDWSFTICGAPILATPEYAARVRARAGDLPITFLGWREEIAEVLAELDLLVVPSSNEGLGRVILEAFSAEVPVVAYPSGGIPELIQDGRTGYLVEPGLIGALAARIRGVVQDESGRESVARAARQLWEAEYTIERYRDRITQIMASAARTASTPAAIRTGE